MTHQDKKNERSEQEKEKSETPQPRPQQTGKENEHTDDDSRTDLERKVNAANTDSRL